MRGTPEEHNNVIFCFGFISGPSYYIMFGVFDLFAELLISSVPSSLHFDKR
mgnify:CR=1 FL=1